MKNYVQNILAQNSTGEIMYICGKCGAEVDKEATVCPKCNAKLGKIKCPFCNFTGGLEDFKDDTCPRCGRKKSKSADLSKKERYFKKREVISFPKRLFWGLFFCLLLTLFLLIVIALYYYNII